MARREQVYAGYMTLDGERIHGEVWVEGDAAVVFATPGNTVSAVLRGVVLAVNEAGFLTVTGDDAESGDPRSLVTEVRERTEGRWQSATVSQPDGLLENAAVVWTNYRVLVTPKAGGRVEYVGAKARTVGRTSFIELSDGTTLPVTVQRRRGCGCGKG